jgi:hypothetical protein
LGIALTHVDVADRLQWVDDGKTVLLLGCDHDDCADPLYSRQFDFLGMRGKFRSHLAHRVVGKESVFGEKNVKVEVDF